MSAENTATREIGILALQGDFAAHATTIEALGATPLLVRTPEELAHADALILPGGESTTIAKLLDRIGLTEPIRDRARAGMPMYGTCAGMILMASEVADRPGQPTLGLMDATVERNAFGRQVDSFEADIEFDGGSGTEPLRGVFIRAPYATRIGEGVSVIARYAGKIVGVRQNRMLATAFHPELTDSTAIHAFLLRLVDESRRR